MRNKKAYMLIEMLAVLALLVVILALSVGPVQTFVRGILGTNKAFDQQHRLETVLDRLQSDIEKAETVFIQQGDPRLGGNVLYLAGSDGQVCYQLADGSATRIEDGDTQQWSLPQVKMQWRLVSLPGNAQAVAVTTGQQHKYRRGDLPAFRGSRLFVVNLYNNLQPQKE